MIMVERQAEFITTEPSETECELVVAQPTPGGGVSDLGPRGKSQAPTRDQ
jgi:hypothetical protein